MNTAKDIINKGAEAVIFKHKNNIIKYRLEKKYRHNIIDNKLRKFRTKREQKVMQKLQELNILSPRLVNSQELNEFMLSTSIDPKFAVTMEHIDGFQLKQLINKDNFEKYGKLIGNMIGKLHSNDIVHGDLTTSNMIVKDNDLFLIDFGLSSFSKKVEDKAVDLHLLKEAINSKHSEFGSNFFNKVLDSYKKVNPNFDEVLQRFNIVELRGKNKH